MDIPLQHTHAAVLQKLQVQHIDAVVVLSAQLHC
jgi:hypothetical protein